MFCFGMGAGSAKHPKYGKGQTSQAPHLHSLGRPIYHLGLLAQVNKKPGNFAGKRGLWGHAGFPAYLDFHLQSQSPLSVDLWVGVEVTHTPGCPPQSAGGRNAKRKWLKACGVRRKR